MALLLLLLACIPAGRAQQNPAQTPPPPPQNPAQTPPPPPEPDTQGGFAIQRTVKLVPLSVSVLNERGQFVAGLKQEDFRVLEDKVEQKIAVFKQEDVPVSLGLVIDNSGSMREKEPQVKAAALTFVKTSNPQDEVFVVNFNDDFYLDTPNDFTHNIDDLNDALDKMDARGSTALYDAVIGSLDHLRKGSKDKKVLLVITDGVDNASRRTLQSAVEAAQRSDALVYSIGIFSDDDIKHNRSDMKRARKALTDLANATGGREYFPESVDDTTTICTQIARDIRNQYTLGYYPSNEALDGTYRTVQVEVNSHGAGKLSVRTRPGYYAKSAPRTASAGAGN